MRRLARSSKTRSRERRALAHHFLSEALHELGEQELAVHHHGRPSVSDGIRSARAVIPLSSSGISTARAGCARDLQGIIVCLQ